MIVKNGPQFSGGISTVFWFIGIIALVPTIAFFVFLLSGELEGRTGLVIAPLVFGISLHPILGYEGVEFDFSNQKFRKYRRLWFWRYGSWRDLKSYKHIVLVKASWTPEMRNVHFFEVYMRKNLHDDGFMLEERDNYFKARDALYYYADVLKLESKDYYEEAIQKNKKYRK